VSTRKIDGLLGHGDRERKKTKIGRERLGVCRKGGVSKRDERGSWGGVKWR